MSQVLARKWRPKNFAELVGQEHVVKALSNALTQQRLHHAYLFTGTRGVGKTTLARIIAKALNCETGITATPCGKCGACTEIDAGRFVDLIELDAASNTQVDNMRDLLENALYAPTSARFKVYIGFIFPVGDALECREDVLDQITHQQRPFVAAGISIESFLKGLSVPSARR